MMKFIILLIKFICDKDSNEAKFRYDIKQNERIDFEEQEDPKNFIEYSSNIMEVFRNIEKYNPVRKPKVLIVFYDVIVGMISNKKLNQIATSN